MLTLPLFTGCATALITPFLPDGSLDEPALRRLIAMQVEAGMDALVLLGTTGEPCTLTMQERERPGRGARSYACDRGHGLQRYAQGHFLRAAGP